MNCIVNKNIILKAILSNKTVLYKFITSVIQLPTADNKQNAVYFISKLYKDKHVTEKSKTANKRRHKDKEYTEK